MLKQTIIWTALPHGSDGPLAAGTTLRLSVLASPRLWNDDPAVKLMKLNAFPDFLDWPALVNQAGFQVVFEGGPTIAATADTAVLRSDLWQALFKNDTDVIPFVFEDLSGLDILSFPSSVIHDTIKGIYQRAATDPGYGGGRDLPGNTVLATDPDLEEIARPVRPEPPYVPVDPDRGPVLIDKPELGEPGDGKKGGCAGCLGCLMWPIVVLRWLLNKLGLLSSLLPMGAMVNVPGGSQANRGGSQDSRGAQGGTAAGDLGGGGGGGPVGVKQQAFDDLKNYLEPTSPQSVALPAEPDLSAIYDFHKMVAAAGDYPNLLRYLGLVVDLEVTVPADLPVDPGKVQVIPTLPLGMATTHYSPKTHYRLGDDRFIARPRPASPEISGGLLRLNDANLFKVQQVDVAGGGIKLQNTATNLVGMALLGEQPANAPDESGLPALQTAGISIVRPEKKVALQQLFLRSYALNSALAAVDGSSLPAPAGGQPAPPPDDELFAEDVVRGYRIDAWDDQAMEWRSLCQRTGDYDFLEPAGGGAPIHLVGEADEGFVQMGSTEPLDPAAPRVLRVHESLFTWDGWSLSAPRPGDAILPDHTTGEVDNPAVTPFKMETRFRATPGSLPRLRFGYSYRLRARVADLAGNSVFAPGDAAFAADQPETTTAFRFRRFEPAGPPTVLLRQVPKEGESLETITVRSAVADSPATISAQGSERHIAPPKTAQLMAERHGKFDGTPGMLKDQAAYDLASREAGSVTHFLNPATGELELIPGVQKVDDPAQKREYWLQSNDSFDVSYLPDPFARGVLLLGLPGMAAADEISDGVNRLAFQGDWPDPSPFRLRVEGLPAGAGPAQPNWDAANRLLRVQVPQGETFEVRICSFFLAGDLDEMAVWGWSEEANPPDLAQLRAQAESGRNWLHLPFRTLLLVHAVQQPLQIPQLSALNISPARQVGDTDASLGGTFSLDAKSTGKVDLWAKWADPLDDPADAANQPDSDTVSQEMHVAEFILPNPADDTPTFAGILALMDSGETAVRHVLGDTKYHRVTYTPIGSTRFREHFPAAVTADPDNLVRPLPTEAPLATELDVPNTARPDAPFPLYLLPTFHWSESEAGGIRTRRRRGGGLRVYMERPWFSSGAGELLGVLVRPANIPPDSPDADTLKRYTSEWGMDPLWLAAELAPLRLTDFLNADETSPPLSLAEIASPPVRAAGFAPVYDSGRGLWFADIEMNVERGYFPFVRLALARFQPTSVPGAHLSRVVVSDFIQLVPHRQVEYDLNNAVGGGTLLIRVSGPGYFNQDVAVPGTSLMVARLEQRQFGDDDVENEAGWQPFVVTLLPPATGNDSERVWQGTLALPDPLPNPVRVVVLEAELYQTEGGGWQDVIQIMGQQQVPGVAGGTATLAEQSDLGYRITFADAILLA
jgi:hypothetical protein